MMTSATPRTAVDGDGDENVIEAMAEEIRRGFPRAGREDLDDPEIRRDPRNAYEGAVGTSQVLH